MAAPRKLGVYGAVVVLLVAGVAVAVTMAGSGAELPAVGTEPEPATGTDSAPGTDTDSVVGDRQWFEEVNTEKGLEYQSTGGKNGGIDGGVYVADYDNDGWQDLLAVGGEAPVLYENTGGEFEPAGELPPLNDTHVNSALFFDYDNDGWQDLLLLPRAGVPVFLENTGGEFERREVGFDDYIGWGSGASAADYDGDGCLDVFVAQYGNWSETVPMRAINESRAPHQDNGFPNILYEGDCSEFENVTAEAGIATKRWTFTTSFVDFTGDGRPDIHVANDYNYDRIYVNQGNGTFEKRRLPNSNRHGMASDVVDVNGDQLPDLFVTNIEYRKPDEIWELQQGLGTTNRGNNLFINQGNGTFADRATEYGVRNTGGWGWAGHLADFDNDGDSDLLHTRKNYLLIQKDKVSAQETYPTVWERTGPETFESRDPEDLGLEKADGRGMAMVDFDRDGDRDFVIATMEKKFKLYENTLVDDETTGDWLSVRVRNQGGVALGSELYLTTTEGTQFSVFTTKANFYAQDARRIHFGLGEAEITRLRVVWPDGTERVFEDVPANRRVAVYHNGTLVPAPRS